MTQKNGGTHASQGKSLEEKRAATKALRRLRRAEKAHAQLLEFKHSRKLMSHVRTCGLIQVAHQNLSVLKRAADFPDYYLKAVDGIQRIKQAATDLDQVLNTLDTDLSEAAREHGLA